MFTVRTNSTNGFDHVKIKMLGEWVKLQGFKRQLNKRKVCKKQ